MSIQYHYDQFPPKSLDWEKIMPWLSQTSAAIARYDSLFSSLPNAHVLKNILTTKEAILSSRIEGIRGSMSEVLEFDATRDRGNVPKNRQGVLEDILNCRQAMHTAWDLLKTLPLSQRAVQKLHEILLSGIRGETKTPGEYRKVSNWISPYKCSIGNASFVPISADKLPLGMDRWEEFVQADFPDVLTQLAILHAEFEALHPFLDGNWRIGRMLIPLFLWQKGLIEQPLFYASAVFKHDREDYYQKLREVSAKNAWTQWCVFFLQALQRQAKASLAKAQEILGLYDRLKEKMQSHLNAKYALQALDWIFMAPVFTSSNFTMKSGIPSATARRILPVLVQAGILTIQTPASGRRPAVYSCTELLGLTEKADAL